MMEVVAFIKVENVDGTTTIWIQVGMDMHKAWLVGDGVIKHCNEFKFVAKLGFVGRESFLSRV